MPPVLAAIAVIGSAVQAAAVTAAVAVETAALGVGLSAGTALAIGNAVLVAVPSAIEFGALAGASAILTPKPKVNTSGSPQAFKADPLAPSTFVMARYGVGGSLVYETTSGGGSKASAGAAGNEFLTHMVILGGLGPYPGIETTQLDDTILTFSGQACNGGYIDSEYVQTYNPGYNLNSNGTYSNNNYSSHVWQTLQLGTSTQGGLPYPDKLNTDGGPLTEWTAAHGFDTFAAVSMVRSYDTTVWSGGVGQPLWTLSGGYPVYDPTQDSTYPGGSGPQRWAGPGSTPAQLWAARATWAPSDNPAIHALNYALGFYLPAADGVVRLYAGCGAGPAGVDVDAFLRAAAVATANGWTITGQWSSSDGKRSVLVAMLQACGAQLISDCGRLSCTVSTPRTALNPNAPITWADLAGPASLDTGTSVRERFNTAYVRYTSETHRWQVVQADTPVKAATYIAEDGGWVRSKTVEFEYVPDVNQACQLGAYAIVDGREIPNIVLAGKPHLRGYDVGDCLMVDLPELGLHLSKLVVLERGQDPSTSIVTLKCRTETDAKHPYALGVSGVAPPTPSISGFDPSIVPAPIPGSWAAEAIAYNDAGSGEIVHVIRINGSTIDNVYAAQVVVSYRQVITANDGTVSYGPWQDETYPSSLETIDLNLPAGVWQVELHYVTVHGSEDVDNTLDLGTYTVQAGTASNTANVGTMSAADVVEGITTAQQQAAAAEAAVNAAAAQIQAATDAATAAEQAVSEAADAAGDQGAQLEDAAEAALAAAVQQGNQLLALHAASFTATGLPIGPFAQETATDTATANSTLAVMGQVRPDGSGFVLNNEGVYYEDGQTLSQLVNQLSSATNAVSATLTSSYLTATQTNSAISTAKTQLQSSINGVSATLTSSYLTSAQTTAAISAAQTTLQSSINGVSATLTSSYMTSAQTTAAISSAQTTLQSSINGVSATLTSSYMTAASTTAAISQAQTTLQSSINGVSATLTSSYLTSAQTTAAISAAQTTLQSSINGVSATLTNNYLTSAQTNSAISAAQLTLQSNINNLSATLTNNYMTSASTTSAISSAQSTLTASINGVGATVSTQGTAIANLQGQASGSLKFSVTSGTNVASLQILAASGGGQNISAVQINASQFQLVDGYGTSFFSINNKFAFLNTRLYVGNSFWIDPVTSVLYAENGNSLLMLGEGFGPSGNMLLWSGPANTDPSQASRSNAFLCLDGNGLYVAPNGNQPIASHANPKGISVSSTSTTEVFNFTVAGIKAGGAWQSTVFFGSGAQSGGANFTSSPSSSVAFTWTLYENGTGVLLASGSGHVGEVGGDPTSVLDQTPDPAQIVGNAATGTVQLNLYVACQTSGQSIANMGANIGVIWTPGAS